MFELSHFIIICAAIGAVVGVLAGLLGIGGGVVIVPALVYIIPHFVEMDPQLVMPLAIGTSLSTIILTSSSSALNHYKRGQLDKTLLFSVALGVALGALLGSSIATSIPGYVLKASFGSLLVLIALQMAFYSNRSSNSTHSPYKLFGVGTLTGTISSIMGIGGGAIMVPSLVWYQVKMTTAIACAALCGMVIAIFGTLGYIVHGLGVTGLPSASIGFVYWPATLCIVCTSVFTTRFGVKLAYSLPTKKLKKYFAVFLLLVGIRMILG
ncbi:sulfite exporter TauE/SafE family protein [Neptunicella marina]|uniref:Probable membrane transporter protein n=1 Tax=Neptunicella marina TaxID=2125989 RepID=A0A8J6M2H7_9ALTE|nr:sulfite exporter TauE/SafE family protein [Neptunicella marina]MBC3766298.1 sulfite exporter TauE/SafE family protein [Neptunicella marina]